MDLDTSPRFVIPDERTPRLYGTLNIVFASLLLLCNLGTAGMLVAAPALKRIAEQWQGQLNAQVQARRQGRLDELKRAVKDAKTEEETARAAAALAKFEAQPPPPPINSMTMGLSTSSDRRIVAVSVIDLSLAMVLDVAMLVAGVGLLRLRESGRKAAVIVAATQLGKLAIFTVISLAFLVPLQMRLMEKDLATVRAQLQGRPGAAPMAAMLSPQGMAAMTTGWIVLYAIVAAIYPILVLVKLTNPRVKAACLAAKPAGLEPS